jgi:PmbA protein
MGFSFKSETFQELTEYALKKAKSLGATDCAVDISEAVGPVGQRAHGRNRNN